MAAKKSQLHTIPGLYLTSRLVLFNSKDCVLEVYLEFKKSREMRTVVHKIGTYFFQSFVNSIHPQIYVFQPITDTNLYYLIIIPPFAHYMKLSCMFNLGRVSSEKDLDDLIF